MNQSKGRTILRRNPRIEVVGSSMYPYIQEGDWVIVEPRSEADIRRGQIISCYVPDVGAYAHRVMKIIQEEDSVSFVLKGDAVLYCDKPVRFEQILGCVTHIERNGHLYGIDSPLIRNLGWLYARIRWALQSLLLYTKRGLQRIRRTLLTG